MLSIILMIIANELTFDRVDHRNTKASWFLKLIISISTVLLLGLILYYHYVNMTYYAYRNRLADWRVQLNRTNVFFILLELVVCLIHPVPRAYPFINPPKFTFAVHLPSHVPIDVALGLPSNLDFHLFRRTSLLVCFSVLTSLSCRSFLYDRFTCRSKYSITISGIFQSGDNQRFFFDENLFSQMAPTVFTRYWYNGFSHW